jgi:hypothetical protein
LDRSPSRSAAIVAAGNEDSTLAWPTVAIHPRPRAPTVLECDEGVSALEIVPFLTVEVAEKFRIVEAIELAAHDAPSVDESGI